MEDTLELILTNKNVLIEKIDSVAGYFDIQKFNEFKILLKDDFVDELPKNGIYLSDLSPHVQKLCNGDYSKLLLIMLLAYSVEL